MLRVENISFGYKGCAPLFSGFDFAASLGKLAVLYGPSGSGKTTLLKILGGVRQPQSGKVFFEHDDINHDIYVLSYADLLHYRGALVGFHFQDYNLLYEFSIEDNIMLPYTLSKQLKPFDQQWFNYLSDVLALDVPMTTLVKHLSGGQQERVSLMRALIQQPRILLLDEPGANLHAELAKKVYQLIQEYAQENYVVVATHDPYFIGLTDHTCSLG